MRCDEVKDNLVAYLDGELSAEDRERVDSHLATCSGCSRERAALASTGDLLRLLDRSKREDMDLASRVIEARDGDAWCRHIRRELVAELDGELEDAEARPVREHVAECAKCAAEADGLRRTVDLLPAWEAPEFDVDLAARIRRSAPRRAGRLTRLLPAAAAAAVLAIAGFAGLRAFRPGPESRTSDLLMETFAEDPELIELAEDLDWLESVAEEELIILAGMGG